MEVMVILSCHPQLHLEQEDPYNLDLDSIINNAFLGNVFKTKVAPNDYKTC